MSEDDAGSDGTTDVAEWTREWLESRAAEQGVPPGELLKRFAAAYRLVEEDAVGVPDESTVDALDAALEEIQTDLEALDEQVESLDEDVSTLDRDVDAKIQDVRERVIQVKRETDTKADADHVHEDVNEHLGALSATTSDLRETVDELIARLERVDARLSAGFENYEDILEYLTEEIDDISEKNTRLARAIVSMREAVQGVSSRESRRMAADRLREQANKHGIRSATCEDCGANLDIALLTDARCPHCSATFASVEPKRGFFGSPTLETGDRPALEAGDARSDEVDVSDVVADGNGSVDVADVFEEEPQPGPADSTSHAEDPGDRLDR